MSKTIHINALLFARYRSDLTRIAQGNHGLHARILAEKLLKRKAGELKVVDANTVHYDGFEYKIDLRKLGIPY